MCSIVSVLGGSKEILDFAFCFATLPTAASTLVFANPYKPDAATKSLLNSGLALGKLIGFPLLFLSAAIFKTDDVHDTIDRLRKAVVKNRIRISEFFRDFDKLRSGYITAA